jgi:hypothetical protein
VENIFLNEKEKFEKHLIFTKSARNAQISGRAYIYWRLPLATQLRDFFLKRLRDKRQSGFHCRSGNGESCYPRSEPAGQSIQTRTFRDDKTGTDKLMEGDNFSAGAVLLKRTTEKVTGHSET